MNSFDEIFTRVLSDYGTFKVIDIKKIISPLSDYEIAAWEELGTGNKAEQYAATELIAALRKALKATSKTDSTSNLTL